MMRRSASVLALSLFVACGPGGGSAPDGGAGDGGGDGGSAGPCNPVTQSGCAAGERCLLSEMGEPICEAVEDGAANIGEACLGTTGKRCVPGAQCLRDPEGPGSRCMRFCDLTTRTGCPAGETCTLKLPNNDDYGFCQPLVECSPLDNTGCEMGTACIAAVDTTMHFFRACVPAGTAVHGEACEAMPDPATPEDRLCAPGHICVTVNDAMGGSRTICLQYCAEDGSAPTCPAGFACENGEALGLTEANEPNTGLCSIPP